MAGSRLRWRSAGCVMMLVALGSHARARGQAGVALVTGVPFSAAIVSTNGDPAKTYTVKFARASNGSTYTELPGGPNNPLPMVSILDMPNHRYISLDPNRKVYTVRLANLPKVNAGQTDDAQVRERIEGLRAIPAKHFDEDGRVGETVPLGFRTVDGFVEYGTKTTYTKLPETSRLAAKVWEQWYVPALYLPAELTGFDEAGNTVRSTKFTDIQTSEPDPHLFEIPQDFAPASSHPIR